MPILSHFVRLWKTRVRHRILLEGLTCNILGLTMYVHYRPQRSWGKVIFSQACVILFTGGGGVCLSACWDTTLQTSPPDHAPTPWEHRHPPGADTLGAYTPQEQTPPQSRPPRADTSHRSRHPPPPTPGSRTPPPGQNPPPRRRTCWEIRSTRWRYASYWNAILFCVMLTKSWGCGPRFPCSSTYTIWVVWYKKGLSFTMTRSGINSSHTTQCKWERNWPLCLFSGSAHRSYRNVRFS